MTHRNLKKIIKKDRNTYDSLSTPVKRLYAFLCQDRDYYVFRYIKLLRFSQYYFEKKKSNRFFNIPYIYFKHLKNKLGRQLGIDAGEGPIGEGLYIAHTGIIIGSAEIGKNCRLHGQNCIGSGSVIGDNCELWVGAKVIGPAHLANGITVAAGAVVVNSFDEENITIGGVPARRIK